VIKVGNFKRALMWFWLLNKRLFKKPGFFIILLFIPILVFAMNFVAQTEESNMMNIVLVQEDKNDDVSSKIVGDLLKEKGLIGFTEVSSPAQARKMVKTGEASAAWIFPKNMQSRLDKVVEKPSKKNYVVEIIEREETVILLLTHEKLVGTVFDYCARDLYIDFVRKNVEGLEDVSDEKLLGYYDNVEVEGEDLFEANYYNSDRDVTQDVQGSYLTAPIRGLLAVLMVLCGLATAMFFIQDDERGTFSHVNERTKPFVALGYHVIPVLLSSVFVFAALCFSGITASVWYELTAMALYILCVAVFCMIVRLLCRNLKVLCAVIPVLLIAVIVASPVFFDISSLRYVQLFLPTFHYLNATFDAKYLLYMVIYFAGASMVYAALSKIFKRA